MPPRVKLVLSLLVTAVIGGFGYYSISSDKPTIGMVTLGLAVMMILAIWIFPETGAVKRKP